MRKSQSIEPRKLEDCRRIYLENKGRDHVKIEREMKELGHRFSRRSLYTTRHPGGISLGWPVRFGWLNELSEEERLRATKRNGGRNEFQKWLREEFPEWQWTWKYQRHVYDKLDRINRGMSRRLMLFLPPRHGKSELVTVRYCAWRLLREPRLNVILGSYNQKLANRFSRKVLRLFEERSEFVRPAPDEKKKAKNPRLRSASEWETGHGGGVRAVGVGSGITGFGGDLIIIDDPVKSRAEAESETFRENVWNWFNDDLYTRLEPNASIILIQTRWHEDDLSGRLLREMKDGGEEWDVVCLPALASDIGGDALGRAPGEALCPERYSREALLKIKTRLGSYSFSALYQQDPVPLGGGLFKREWFTQVVEQAPKGLRWARAYDLAISTKTSADYTASFRCAFDKQGNLYIADGFRKRIEYPEQRRFIIERMLAEENTQHGIEKAMHGQAIVQDLRREPSIRHTPFADVAVSGDKFTRALAWANLAEAGKVVLVRGPWIGDFIEEACRFTGKNDAHDDQVDAVSAAVKMLSVRRGKGVSL